jgi:hypothetical protein
MSEKLATSARTNVAFGTACPGGPMSRKAQSLPLHRDERMLALASLNLKSDRAQVILAFVQGLGSGDKGVDVIRRGR